MDLRIFSERAIRTVFFARYEAAQAGAPEVSSAHLVLGVLREGRNVSEVLSAMGVTRDAVRSVLVAGVSIAPLAGPVNDELPLSVEAEVAVDHAREEARSLGSARVEPIHLLIGVLREVTSPATLELASLGLSASRVRAYARRTQRERPPLASGTTTIDICRLPPGTSGSRHFDRWEFSGFTLRALMADVYDVPATRIDLPSELDSVRTYELRSAAPDGTAPEDTFRIMPAQVRAAIDAHFGITTARATRAVDVQVLTAPDGELRATKESDFESGGFATITLESSETIRHNLPPGLRRLFGGAEPVPRREPGQMTSVSGSFSMPRLCQMLEQTLGSIVVDETGSREHTRLTSAPTRPDR